MSVPRVPPRVYKYTGNHRPKYTVLEKDTYFRAVVPLKLKDQITGRDTTSKQVPCVNHLIEMIDCLKRTGFIDSPCKQQITAFKQCNEDFKKTEQMKQMRAEEGFSSISNAREMKRNQLNAFLKNFAKRS